MSSIIKKRRGGSTYLYAATSARVEGQPRIVDQVYLGTEEEVIARLTGGPGGDPSLPETVHRGFGDVTAVWGMLARLDAIGVIDSVVGGRAVSGGVSVGTYLGLAALNRVCDPRSKRGFAGWWASTALGRVTRIRAAALDHRRFWYAMDAVTVEQLEQIEAALTRRVIEVFDVDTHALILDMTNFATFIDSGNDRAPIAQRGKAKQKRYDLRIVGLGLVATRDGGIPLLSRAYPGNKVDVTQFTAMIEELARRYTGALSAPGGATLTFDAGQNSEPNFTRLAELGLHFVGSVPPGEHPGLLARPAADRAVVPAYAEENLTAFETRTRVLGRDRRVILTHSVGLHTAQQVGFAQTLGKAGTALTALAGRLARGRTRRPRPKVEAEIDTICAPRWAARVITTDLTGDTPASMRLDWRIDEHAQAGLEDEIFGKRILVTDHDDWPLAQVYRRLPLPGVPRGRVPTGQRPPRGLLRPDPPLHRPQDPRPPVHLRARPDHRAPDAPRMRPGRPVAVGARDARRARRHRRDRPALPRRTRPAPGPPHDHQDDPHPAAPLRDLRPRPVCPPPLTWVIRQTEDRKLLDLRKPQPNHKIFGNSG